MHSPTVGSWEGAVSYERGTPVLRGRAVLQKWTIRSTNDRKTHREDSPDGRVCPADVDSAGTRLFGLTDLVRQEYFPLHSWRICTVIDSGRGTTRAEDAQGTPFPSHISPSMLVYEENPGMST